MDVVSETTHKYKLNKHTNSSESDSE